MAFEGGVKAAAKMLAGLGTSEREKLLKIISAKSPEMAQALKENLVSFEDLIHITPKMLVELLRQVEVDDLALAMRVASPDLKAHLLKLLPGGIRKQLEAVLLGPPRLVGQVEEAQDKVMKVVRAMCERGELVLRAGGDVDI